MRLLLIGPPGCGKGTQGARIANRYGVEHIAAGDILREHVTAGTELGARIARYIDAGELVPDTVILAMIVPRVLAAAEREGYVLDGFPRSVPQAVEARRIAQSQGSAVRRAIFLRAPEDELTARLLRRAELEGRADDTPTVIRNRLEVFGRATAPVLDFYRGLGLLDVVDATLPPDEVTARIIAALPPLVRARSQNP